MFAITVLTAFIHAFILVQAVRFFRTVGPIRETDKTSVACIAALSVMFLLGITLGWMAQVPIGFSPDLGRNMMLGWQLAASVVFLGQLQIVTTRKAHNACSPG